MDESDNKTLNLSMGNTKTEDTKALTLMAVSSLTKTAIEPHVAKRAQITKPFTIHWIKPINR